MKLHTESAACHTRAHCAACQDPGAEGRQFRLSRRAAGYLDLPKSGDPIPCPHGMEPPPIVTADSGGPGTELKRLLARRLFRWLGVREFPGCKCQALAKEMNELGPDGCEGKLDDLVGALKDNHAALVADKAEHGDGSYTVPFSEACAGKMVRDAIRRARNVQIRHARGERG